MSEPQGSIASALAERAEGSVSFSFEYFPPRTDDGVANLKPRIVRMAALRPLFMDVTWGAGGSTSTATADIAAHISSTGVLSNQHLTCTNMEAGAVDRALDVALSAGIRNVVALRGDPPAGVAPEDWAAIEGGFTCALDLIRHIRSVHGTTFGLTASCYPEGHPLTIRTLTDDDLATLSDSERTRLVTLDGVNMVCCDADFEREVDYVASKVAAGAQVLITQMVFDANVFFAFVAALRSRGVTVPVIPGVMIVQNTAAFKRMSAFCKSRVPSVYWERLEAAGDDAEAVRAAGIDLATALCRELLAGGITHLHFYTMNLEKSTVAILRNLGLIADDTAYVAEEAK